MYAGCQVSIPGRMALSNLLTDAGDICLPWGTIQNRKQGEQYPKKEAQGTVRTEENYVPDDTAPSPVTHGVSFHVQLYFDSIQ